MCKDDIIYLLYIQHISLHLIYGYQLRMSLTLTPPPQKKKTHHDDWHMCHLFYVANYTCEDSHRTWKMVNWKVMFLFNWVNFILHITWVVATQNMFLSCSCHFHPKNWGMIQFDLPIFFQKIVFFNHQLVTLPKFNTSPLKSYRNPSRKGSSSNHNHHFSGVFAVKLPAGL